MRYPHLPNKKSPPKITNEQILRELMSVRNPQESPGSRSNMISRYFLLATTLLCIFVSGLLGQEPQTDEAESQRAQSAGDSEKPTEDPAELQQAQRDKEGFDAAPGARPLTDCVLVQPIVLRDDDGKDPAHFRISEPLVDRVYSTAGIDFHFLEARYFDHTAARDGTINLDTIVKEAEKAGILRRQGEQITMFFVNTVDGKPGPLGRAQTPGSIVFIALTDKEREVGEDAFVVGHESGHNLGLIHAVDDDMVPNDVPNLMGDGPFPERMGLRGLIEYQINIVRNNPLCQPRIDFFESDRARQAIIDESYETYFERLHWREIATLTGEQVEGASRELMQDVARERFQDSVRSFTEREKEAIRWMVTGVKKHYANKFPIFEHQPWKFIKVREGLCGNFSHTRGPCIIFSQKTVDRIVNARHLGSERQGLLKMGPLFVHEQIHVLQRLYPQKFAGLYRDIFRLHEASDLSDAWVLENEITNPDASGSVWLVKATADDSDEPRYFWPLTVLKGNRPIATMGKDFRGIAIAVKRNEDNVFEILTQENGEPDFRELSGLSEHSARFPVTRGLEHPNEIAAYMLASMFAQELGQENDSKLTPLQAEMSKNFKAWCEVNLR